MTGKKDRFGPNGAVLDKLSEDMRAEYENPSHRTLEGLSREGFVRGVAIAAVLLGGMVAVAFCLQGRWAPTERDLMLASVWAAVCVALTYVDWFRTMSRRQALRVSRLRWSDQDAFSRFTALFTATVGWVFGVVILTARLQGSM